ncbi:acyl-CoA dehydrogenase family protein, partial [Pseudomonadota bacterium]
MAKLNPFDLYDVVSLLSEEELMIKDSVARFVDERAMPVIAKHFDDATFPHELVPEIAEMGLLGSTIEGYGCAGLNSVSYGLICQEMERCDSGL